jgi:hypothetical protein
MMFMRVDLPEPEGAHDGHVFAARHGQGNVPQGVDNLAAHFVAAADVFEADQAHGSFRQRRGGGAA